MVRYLAVIHQEERSTFGVSFPDFPGCIGAGRTLDLALRNAAEALAFHIEGLEEDGEPIPRASDYGKAIATVVTEDDDNDCLVGFHWVTPSRTEPDRAVRLNITLPQSLVDEIDVRAGERGRSGFLATAAREKLGGEERRVVRGGTPLKRKRAAG